MDPKGKQHFTFNELLNNLDVGTFRCSGETSNTRFVFVNATLCQLLGYEEADILKLTVSDIFEDKRKFRYLAENAASLNKVVQEDIHLKAKNQRLLPCSITILAIREGKKTPEYFDVVVRNINDAKRVEKDFRESKELFKTVFNNSAVAMMVADQDEKVVAWNPFTEQLLGMDKMDLFNKPVEELYPPQEWKRIRALQLRQKNVASDIEVQVYKKDGSPLDVSMSLSLIKDADGNIMGSIGIMHDITKQKLAERKIKESENKIRIILDNSAAAITLTDDQERIVSWNRYTEHLFGMTKEDLYLKPVSSLYPPEEWTKIRKAEIRKLGSKHHLETQIIRKDGQPLDVDLSINVLKDANDNIIGSVGILQDITEQKRFQQMLLQAKMAAEEANSAKSLFLANMSHEVRTPMTTITGMIDLTLDSDLTPDQRENLSTVKNAAEILLSLLNDILDLSRVEAGKVHLEDIELNLHNIVQSVCKGLSVLARNKNLELQWQVDSNVPDTLIGDPVRIRQILVNLINNAIKFTFQGKIVTAVKLKGQKDDSYELQFSVTDEGIGIPQDKQNSIFEVFTQADTSTTRRFGGTGLGLSISKRLVEMMGGQIWVESEEFKGSTFFFTAKLKAPSRSTSPAQPPSETSIAETAAQLSKKSLASLSILLAEDNVVNQKMVVRMLEKKGWKVRSAENGKQVLDYLDKEPFDVILMDAQMPLLDGFETTKLIRENEKKTGRHIPIIALTARVMAGDEKKCLDCGMDGYVAKPIDRQKLYEVIENSF